jgi:excisionase family DNA binding protein
MAEKIPHHANLRDVIRRGIDHLKAALDCGGEVLITLLEDHRAETRPVAVERETGPGPIPTDKRELSVKELAARWGVSTRSIYEWKTTKGLPYIPHGRCLRFDWVEVDAWSKRHRESFTRARLRVVK